MNDINDQINKQSGVPEECIKDLKKGDTIILETGDKNISAAEEANVETHEKPILEEKSQADNNDEQISKLSSEAAKESETNLKTDTLVHEHSERVVDKKENDQNELNNKIKQTKDIDSDEKVNVECKDKDDDKEDVQNITDKDDVKSKENGDGDNKDGKEDVNNYNEVKATVESKECSNKEDVENNATDETVNATCKGKDDDKSSPKSKDNNEEDKSVDSAENRSDDSNAVSITNEDTTEKKGSDASLTQRSHNDKDHNKEDKGKQIETGHDTSSEVNEEIDDVEFEDVEIPDGIDELIVPDEGEDDDLSNADDDDNEDSHDHDKTPNDENISKDLEAAADTAEDVTKLPKISDEEESCHSAIESELVAIEEATKHANLLEEDQSTNDDEASNNTASDPLNCLPSPEDGGGVSNGGDSNTFDGNDGDSNTGDGNGGDSNTGDGNGGDSNTGDGTGDTNNENDDDDDVQFVETRNSPICIESDDDEPSGNASSHMKETQTSSNTTTDKIESDTQTITLPSSAVITVPKNLTVTRTSARKSTARPQYVASPPTTVPQKQNQSKNFSYLNKATNYRHSIATAAPRMVVDTIELLDSSDEETTNAGHNKTLPPKFKTPPKRTLLAAKSANSKSPIKISNAQRGGMPNNFSTQIRKQPKKPAPPPLPPPTPQSNFLNAVQLQPAAAGVNPPAFSALLFNKSVIIPNAFYGNPPGVRGNSADAEAERRYARWLDNFITQFCNPQLVASHSCFVFLQRALKYKDFVRIKNIRTRLNINAQTATDQLNHQLMLDLRSIFLKNSKEITAHGRRFCELTCSMMQNKSVTLLVHGITSRVIMKTCNMDIPKSTLSSSATTSSSSSSPSTSNSTNPNSSSTSRKRQLYEDEDEYVPGKNKIKIKPSAAPVAVERAEGKHDLDGPKRSLRSKRTKRLDNSFSYNEDDLAEYDIEDDEEEAERLAQEEIQRKIEQKRLEAQRQRQKQAKSFESAFLEVFAKSLEEQALNVPATIHRTPSSQRARLNNSSTVTSVAHHALHNDAEDLLQATWIENVENDDTQVISDDDEPREHRVYKQQQQFQRQHQLQRCLPNENYHYPQGPDPRWPKNTDTNLYVTSKNKDICVICKLSVQRIVHHYVNEHRGCEVYNSRLTPFQLEHLKRGACNIINISLYKNGQPQYEAHCIFCQKQSRFMLPYWFQHFTMHTGEYAYRCSGCNVRKPTRSLLTQHQSQGGCPQGASVLQDYSHDVKKARVEARICTLCNYVQLHRNNIVKHLHHQHNIKQILPKHIQTIVLLKDQSTPGPSMPTPEVTITRRKQSTPASSSASSHNSPYVIDDDDDDDTLLFAEDALPPMQYQQQQQQQQQAIATNAQNQYYNYMPPYMMNNHHNFTWEDNDPSDDLSFMICGMLDVQMNTE